MTAIFGQPYQRAVPDTWEEHHSFHQYMKMYENMNKDEAIAYAKKHFGPAPAKVMITPITVIANDDDDLDS